MDIFTVANWQWSAVDTTVTCICEKGMCENEMKDYGAIIKHHNWISK